MPTCCQQKEQLQIKSPEHAAQQRLALHGFASFGVKLLMERSRRDTSIGEWKVPITVLTRAAVPNHRCGWQAILGSTHPYYAQ